MNFNAPTETYHWKISLFGGFNFVVMLVHRLFECAEFPYNFVYVFLQDTAMLAELRHVFTEVDMAEVRWLELLNIVASLNWTFHLYLFTFLGIHMVLLQDLMIAKPQYCKELNAKLGLS